MEWYWIVLITVGATAGILFLILYWLFKDFGKGWMG